jgi:hypothetical protein
MKPIIWLSQTLVKKYCTQAVVTNFPLDIATEKVIQSEAQQKMKRYSAQEVFMHHQKRGNMENFKVSCYSAKTGTLSIAFENKFISKENPTESSLILLSDNNHIMSVFDLATEKSLFFFKENQRKIYKFDVQSKIFINNSGVWVASY